MRKLFLLLAISVLTSCSTEETFDLNDCAVETRLILEEYQPLLEELLPEDPTSYNPFFDWQPFKDLVAERDAKIQALNCEQYI